MLDIDKIKLTNQLQKDMSTACYERCSTVHNQPCFDTCADKYMRTVALVNETLKEMGYDKNSVFAYKAYPDPPIESEYHWSDKPLDTRRKFRMVENYFGMY